MTIVEKLECLQKDIVSDTSIVHVFVAELLTRSMTTLKMRNESKDFLMKEMKEQKVQIMKRTKSKVT